VKPIMRVRNDDARRILNLNPKPAWAEVWHVWKVLLPRRSITGRLVSGKVWRRHDGRRWIYKKLSVQNDGLSGG
jgi:hypothetical protein